MMPMSLLEQDVGRREAIILFWASQVSDHSPPQAAVLLEALPHPLQCSAQTKPGCRL